MKHLVNSVFTSTFLFLFLTTPAFAHESVHWFQYIQGDKMLAVFYNLDAFQQNVEQKFLLRYAELSNGKSIKFDKAEVTILQNRKEVESFDLWPNKNYDAEFSYEFPVKGEYALEAKVMTDGKAIVNTSFPIVVGEGVVVEKRNGPPGVVYILVGAGITLAALELKRRKLIKPLSSKSTKKGR